MKPNWIDMLVYRLFFWRWSKILTSRPEYRELLISWLKTYDVLNDGTQVKISIIAKNEP